MHSVIMETLKKTPDGYTKETHPIIITITGDDLGSVLSKAGSISGCSHVAKWVKFSGRSEFFLTTIRGKRTKFVVTVS